MPSSSRALAILPNTVIEITTSGGRGSSNRKHHKPVELKHTTRKAGTFDRYIAQLIKQVDTDLSLSSKAVAVMDSMLTDIGSKICIQAGSLSRYNDRGTVTLSDAQAAIVLTLKGEIAKKAVIEGARAVQVYSKLGKALGDSTSERCQLVFPVPRVATMLKSKSNLRTGMLPAVLITAALEYVASEILELAGKAIKDQSKSRIMPRHVKMVIESDSELNKMFAGSSFVNG